MEPVSIVPLAWLATELNPDVSALIQALACPLKVVLSAHHLEKKCGFEILQKLVQASDHGQAEVIERKFGGKLFCKTNEPEKLQLLKLDILQSLQFKTKSEALLDELVF